MPTEDAYSSGHLVLSHFWTCMCSNVETNLSWTCLVSGPLNFEHPSVLLFCAWQSGRIYCGNVARIKTVNRQCDIVIVDSLIGIQKYIKLKEMMNSLNYILVTYLPDIESKFSLCHICMDLVNFSFSCIDGSIHTQYSTGVCSSSSSFK